MVKVLNNVSTKTTTLHSYIFLCTSLCCIPYSLKILRVKIFVNYCMLQFSKEWRTKTITLKISWFFKNL